MTSLKKQVITRQAILNALHEFSAQYHDMGDYDNWLSKDNYIYAVFYDGRVYPPKHILSVVSGIPTSDFSGGEETNRVYRRLGFEVGLK